MTKVKLLAPSYVKDRIRYKHWYQLDADYPRMGETGFKYWENSHLQEYFIPTLTKLHNNSDYHSGWLLVGMGRGDLLAYIELDKKRRFRLTSTRNRTTAIVQFCRTFIAWLLCKAVHKAQRRGLAVDADIGWALPPAAIRDWIECSIDPTSNEEKREALHTWKSAMGPYGWYCNMSPEKALWSGCWDAHSAAYALFDCPSGKDWLGRTRKMLDTAGYYYESAMHPEPRSLVEELARTIIGRKTPKYGGRQSMKLVGVGISHRGHKRKGQPEKSK
jgi:hypothetical protein